MNNRQTIVSDDPNIGGHTRSLKYGHELLEIDGYHIALVPVLYD